MLTTTDHYTKFLDDDLPRAIEFYTEDILPGTAKQLTELMQPYRGYALPGDLLTHIADAAGYTAGYDRAQLVTYQRLYEHNPQFAMPRRYTADDLRDWCRTLSDLGLVEADGRHVTQAVRHPYEWTHARRACMLQTHVDYLAEAWLANGRIHPSLVPVFAHWRAERRRTPYGEEFLNPQPTWPLRDWSDIPNGVRPIAAAIYHLTLLDQRAEAMRDWPTIDQVASALLLVLHAAKRQHEQTRGRA